MPSIKTDCKPRVLRELKRHGIIERAARKVGVSSQTIRRWCQEDAVFKQAFDGAVTEGRA